MIAYSTFGAQPPGDAAVSRVYSPVFKRPPDRTKRVVCTNPSALVGGVGENKPYFPTRMLPGPLSAMSPAHRGGHAVGLLPRPVHLALHRAPERHLAADHPHAQHRGPAARG